MNKDEFSIIRSHLKKTQNQMARLLGVSIKTIQSFEQGFRNVPVHVERQILFLLAHKKSKGIRRIPCWKARNCPHEKRDNCPAWEFQLGYICWFINGTFCNGEARKNWQEKMELCRNCDIFTSLLPKEVKETLNISPKIPK